MPIGDLQLCALSDLDGTLIDIAPTGGRFYTAGVVPLLARVSSGLQGAQGRRGRTSFPDINPLLAPLSSWPPERTERHRALRRTARCFSPLALWSHG
jgi:hypothetical protein